MCIQSVALSFFPSIFALHQLQRRSATMSAPKSIVLMSSDGETFEIEELVAMESQLIKCIIKDDCDNCSLHLPISGKILAKIIEYCKRHVEAAKAADGGADKAAGDYLKAFDVEFVKVDQNILFDLIEAADYLNIKTLIDLTCRTLAHMMKGMTPEEIRQFFNIKNDFTP